MIFKMYKDTPKYPSTQQERKSDGIWTFFVTSNTPIYDFSFFAGHVLFPARLYLYQAHPTSHKNHKSTPSRHLKEFPFTAQLPQ
jgi:hypothetical protein